MPKRRILTVLALVSVLGSLASCRSKKRAEESPAELTFRLPNGLQVDLLATPGGDRAALIILFEVGMDHDPPGRSGMTHLIEHLLMTSRGAGAAQPGEATAAAHADGLTVQTGSDHTTYSIVVPADRLLDELEVAAARMAKLEIVEADLERARTQVLERLASQRGGDATATAMSCAVEAVQPARGGGRRGGIAAEVEAIDLAEVQAFYQKHFVPGNARLIVTGRFDPKKVRARVETAFASLPSGTRPALRDPADSTVTGTLVMGDAPAAVAIAVPAPALSEPAYPAFLVLAARLVGDSSQPRAWAARYDPLEQPETLFLTGAMQPGEQPEAAAARIRAEATTLLALPLTPGDIAASRGRFALFLALDTPRSATSDKHLRRLAIARARRAQLRLPETDLAKALEGTTQEQLAEAAALFDPKRTAAVVAGGTIH